MQRLGTGALETLQKLGESNWSVSKTLSFQASLESVKHTETPMRALAYAMRATRVYVGLRIAERIQE